ncbi:MAG: hypothetical protein ACE5HO_03735 [bacterium]
MKSIAVFITISLVLSVLLTSNCTEQSSSESSGSIELISSNQVGCVTAAALSDTGDNASLDWHYENGILQLDFEFRTLCSAQCRDSVNVSENAITILLEDTSSVAAHCTCEMKEVFSFNMAGYEWVQVSFSFKPYASENYISLIDQIIEL